MAANDAKAGGATRMIRGATGALTLALLVACSSGGWTSEQRQEYLDACKGKANEQLCFCAVDYLAENYDFKEFDEGAAARAIRECQ